MTHSPACTSLVAEFEGCKLTAYQDSNLIWTIGYGHTQGVKQGATCTEQQALDWLSADLDIADAAVNRLVKLPLTQGQFDALVSFTYNLGAARLAGSTLLMLLDRSDFIGAANQFLSWCMADGKTVPGLLRRRNAERTMFQS
jgi:lysozyme